MERTRTRTAVRLLLAAWLAASSVVAQAAVEPAEPAYDMRMETVRIAMPDGVRLAADLFLPDGGEAVKRFPVLLEYLPYRKDESLDRSYRLYRYFVERGFVVARVDIRGTGNSEGRLVPYEYSDQEWADGDAVLDWLAEQPWSHAFPHEPYPKPGMEWRHEAVRWFDHWLKRRDTGIMDEPAFTVYVREWHPPGPYLEEAPGYWRWEDGWPIERIEEQVLFPQPNHNLKAAAPPRTNWFVRLNDIAPDGTVTQVAGAGFNGTHRKSARAPADIVPGEPFALDIEMHFTSWVFPKGHRIRLSISNAQWPMFWPTPYPVTTTLQLGEQTRLVLPVVPASAEARPAPDFLPPVEYQVEFRGAPGFETLDIGTPSGYGEISSVDRNPQTGEVTVRATNSGGTIYPWGTETIPRDYQ